MPLFWGKPQGYWATALAEPEAGVFEEGTVGGLVGTVSPSGASERSPHLPFHPFAEVFLHTLCWVTL